MYRTWNCKENVKIFRYMWICWSGKGEVDFLLSESLALYLYAFYYIYAIKVVILIDIGHEIWDLIRLKFKKTIQVCLFVHVNLWTNKLDRITIQVLKLYNTAIGKANFFGLWESGSHSLAFGGEWCTCKLETVLNNTTIKVCSHFISFSTVIINTKHTQSLLPNP